MLITKETDDIEKILIDFLSFLNENGYINDYDFVYETQIKKFIKQIKTNKMEVITDLNEIDRSTKEGRLLFAALAKITTESQTDKTPYEVLEQLEDLATKMDMNIDKMIEKLEEKYSSLLNEYSKGNVNNEVMQIYRSQMKNVLDFINQLKQVKNCFIPDVSNQREQLKAFADYVQGRMWEGEDKDFLNL